MTTRKYYVVKVKDKRPLDVRWRELVTEETKDERTGRRLIQASATNS
jgi:hypothetical protein